MRHQAYHENAEFLSQLCRDCEMILATQKQTERLDLLIVSGRAAIARYLPTVTSSGARTVISPGL
jgi:hypothetical protein